MEIISLKCPQCGGDIQINSARGEGYCTHCGTKCMLSKNEIKNEIKNETHNVNQTNNYNQTSNHTETNTSVVTNIGKQINYNYAVSEFEKEKKQCKVLLMLMQNFDLANLQERALRVLDLNPDNSLALMIYNCDFDFRITNQTELVFLKFNEEPLLNYITQNKGSIDAETSVLFAKMLLYRVEAEDHTDQIMAAILKNLDAIHLSAEQKAQTYTLIVNELCNKGYLSALAQMKKLGGISAVLSVVNGDSYEASQARSLRNEAEIAAQFIVQLRTRLAKVLAYKIKNSDIGAADKQRLLNTIQASGFLTGTANNTSANTTSGTSTNSSAQSSSKVSWYKGLMWGGIIAFIFFIILVIFVSSSWLMFIGAAISLILAIVFGVLYKKNK